jgi:hypothetical protein
MKSQSDDKEPLSRRRFATSFAAALAAVPVASALASAQRRRERGVTQQPQTPARTEDALAAQRERNEHDTPPPLLIINGSFIVETENDFAAGDIINIPGPKRRHNIRPEAGKNRVFPAHIKVVDGSGEILYRLDVRGTGLNPHPAESVKITARLTDGTVVEAASTPVVGNMQTYAIDTDRDTSLVAPAMPGDVPASPKRRARRRLRRPDGAGPNLFIDRLTITQGGAANVLYSISPPNDLTSRGEELKIMIWLEEKNV